MSEPATKRYLVDPLTAGLVHLLFGLFSLLPPGLASALGAGIGRLFGPAFLRRAHRTGLANLARAFPDGTARQHRAWMKGCWGNLGRIMGEYPHLDKIYQSRTELVGAEHLETLRDDGRPGAVYCFHLANWELMPRAFVEVGIAMMIAYREPNNRMVRGLLARTRRNPSLSFAPKGADGARKLLQTLKADGHITLLIDQKMNDGIPVPLFGQDAMTAPAIAQLARKNNAPVLAVQVERLRGCRFRITVHPPWQVPVTTDRGADIRAAMGRMHRDLEAFIRMRPEQWLWIHNRWPKGD